MHAVVNRLRLQTPVPDEVFAAAQRQLPARVAEIPGIRAFHVLRAGAEELVVLILADDADSIERMRAEIGDAWMRENVVPHLAGPTERVVAEGVVSFERES